jgi:hypothetical protein
MSYFMILPIILLISCGGDLSRSSVGQSNDAYVSMPEVQPGYVEMLNPQRLAQIRNSMPALFDQRMHSVMHSPQTMWYDETAIVPGYQDSMGSPVGMRPNTIESILINLAVPGGWERLFAFRGRFNFPFGTGGADRSPNLVKINFWHVPRDESGILPVVYWRLNFSRWRWLFPKGTIMGEVLLVKLSNGSTPVFEVRTRERTLDGWVNAIFRPYLTSTSLSRAIKSHRPDWASNPKLRSAVNHLESSGTLSSSVLRTQQYAGSFADQSGYLDVVPSLGDAPLVEELLRPAVFQPVRSNIVWKSDGGKVAFAASSASGDNIVPSSYDGGMLAVDDVSCRRCHDQAGRQIGNFHDEMVLYGELWGEDETFSWHPFENSKFVDQQGNVKNFNDDNRSLRSDFAAAGLVVPYDRNRHPASIYRDLPRTWTYRPVVGDDRSENAPKSSRDGAVEYVSNSSR